MKLIIDITEETISEIKDNAMFASNISSDIRWNVTGAIVNGTPFEDIKAEIQKYIDENKQSEDLYLSGCGDGAYHSLAIIEKNLK